MKLFVLTILALIVCSLEGYSQIRFPLEYRVEKQAMCTPMELLEDVLFRHPYYAKPVNIHFDGEQLKMNYDEGTAHLSKKINKVHYESEFEDDKLALEKIYYCDQEISTDTFLLVVDYNVGYVQFIVPTKDSTGENIGYTSYRKFVKTNELALN
jgi:hypothetical protein